MEQIIDGKKWVTTYEPKIVPRGFGVRVNPVRKAIVKEALKRGKTSKQALLEAGYAPSTAAQGHKTTVLPVARRELLEELKAKQLDADYFINKVEKQVIESTNDPDVKRKGIVDQARFAGIDKQQQVTNIWNIEAIDTKDIDALTKLARRRKSNG